MQTHFYKPSAYINIVSTQGCIYTWSLSVTVSSSTTVPASYVSAIVCLYIAGLNAGPNWFLVTWMVKALFATWLGFKLS